VINVLNIVFDDKYGGCNKRVVDVANRLKKNVKTTIVMPDTGGATHQYAEKLDVHYKKLGYRRAITPARIIKFIFWLLHLPVDIYLLRKYMRLSSPDLVHVNGSFNIGPVIAAKINQTPLLWHINDTVFPESLSGLAGKMINILSTRVIVAARAVAEHYKLKQGSFDIIYAPVDTDKIEFHPKTLSMPLKLCAIANLNYLKGFEYLYESIFQLKKYHGINIELHIAGARLASQKDYIQKIDLLAEKYDINDCIIEYGFIDNISDFLMDKHILVLASISEASPMAVLEAMSSGTPVVATDVGGVRELLANGAGSTNGIIVQPRSSSSLSKAIIKLVNSNDLYAEFSKNGRNLVERKYSLEQCAKQHMLAYEKYARKNISATP
jgi:glycosyltransferase involved in cell wall biosynthesis